MMLLGTVVEATAQTADYYSGGTSPNYLEMVIAVDPSNRRVIEIEYTAFCYNGNSRLLDISPEKIAAVENAIKQESVVSEISTWGHPNYLLAIHRLFVKRRGMSFSTGDGGI